MSCITTAATTHHRRASVPALRQAGALWPWRAQGDSAWCERLEGVGVASVQGRGAHIGRVGSLPVRADGQGEQGGAERVSEAGRRLRAGGRPGRADGPGRLVKLACRASGWRAGWAGAGCGARVGRQGRRAGTECMMVRGWLCREAGVAGVRGEWRAVWAGRQAVQGSWSWGQGRQADACGAPDRSVHGHRVARRAVCAPTRLVHRNIKFSLVGTAVKAYSCTHNTRAQDNVYCTTYAINREHLTPSPIRLIIV
jgi:hypothetical protein